MNKLLMGIISLLLIHPMLPAQDLSAVEKDQEDENILHMIWTADDNNYDSTIVYGKAALQINPVNAEVWFLLSRAYKNMGNDIYYYLTLAQTFACYTGQYENLIDYSKDEINKMLEDGIAKIQDYYNSTVNSDYDEMTANNSLLKANYKKCDSLINIDKYTEALEIAIECIKYTFIDHELLQIFNLTSFFLDNHYETLLYSNFILYLNGDDYKGGMGKYTLGFTTYEKSLANATEGIIFSKYSFLLDPACVMLHKASDHGLNVSKVIEETCN